MESDGLGLDFTFLLSSINISAMLSSSFLFFCNYLNIDLVTAKNNRNVFADTDEITMPVGDVLVSDSGGDIKHDDGTLTTNAINKV